MALDKRVSERATRRLVTEPDDKLRVGFTGSRVGMTDGQLRQLGRFLHAMKELSGQRPEFHHGDCVGADKEAHIVARALGFVLAIHPPEDDALRAFCKGEIMYEPKPYLERNHDIVNQCGLLIAAPRSKEVQHSGTWATIRYARKKDVRTEII